MVLLNLGLLQQFQLNSIFEDDVHIFFDIKVNRVRRDPAQQSTPNSSRLPMFSPTRQSLPLVNGQTDNHQSISIQGRSFGIQDSRFPVDDLQLQNPDEEIMQEEQKYSTQTQIIKTLVLSLSVQMLQMVLFFYVVVGFSYRYVLLYLWMVDVTAVFLLIFFSYRQGYKCVCQLLETMYLFFFKMFIVFFYEVQFFEIDYVSIVMLGLQFLRIIAILIQHFRKEVQNCESFLIACVKTSVMVQVTFITLRWVSKITWPWSQILVVTWVLIFVAVILDVIALFCFIECVVHYMTNKKGSEQVYGSLWLLFTITTIIVPAAFCVFYITRHFDQGLKNDEIFVAKTIGYLLVGTAISELFYTLVYFDQISQYLESIQGVTNLDINGQSPQLQDDQGDGEMGQVEDEASFQPPNLSAAKRPPKKKISIKFDKVQLPLYLVKISASFFDIKPTTYKQTRNLQRTAAQQVAQSTGANIRQTMSASQVQKEKTINASKINSKIIKNDDITPEIVPMQVTKDQERQESLNSKGSVMVESCLVCCENKAVVVLIPCRHGGLCLQCTKDLLARSKECYMCRSPIRQILKLDENEELKVVGISNIDEKTTLELQ